MAAILMHRILTCKSDYEVFRLFVRPSFKGWVISFCNINLIDNGASVTIVSLPEIKVQGCLFRTLEYVLMGPPGVNIMLRI